MKISNHKLLPFSLLLAGSILPSHAKPINEKLLQQEHHITLQSEVLNTTQHVKPLTTRFTLKRIGAAKNAVVQGIAVDPKSHYIYTTNVTGKPSKGVINRYHFDDSIHKTAIDAQKPSDYIGHQGIAVEPQTSKIWASAGDAVKNHGWYAVRFNYQASKEPGNIQTIKLFDKGYSKSTNSMPTFSPNGKYLVVRSFIKKDGQGRNVIRVFDFSKVKLESNIDLSKHYLYEWQADKSLTSKNFPFQGMATDGKFVYMISGYGYPNNVKLQVYTLQGKLVQNMQNVTLGKHEAFADGNEHAWEPEGLAVSATPQNSLFVIFATGDKGKRNARVYSIDIN